jgi:hypothetical protein
MLVAHETRLGDLTKSLVGLQADLELLPKRSEVRDIIELIKAKRGWTTPAELAFANGIAKSLQAQVQQLNALITSFADAAHQVEVKM